MSLTGLTPEEIPLPTRQLASRIWVVGEDIVTIETPYSVVGSPGKKIRVNVNVAWAESLSKALVITAEHCRWRPRRIDSFNPRRIKGSRRWSMHAIGMGLDFFDVPPGVSPVSVRGPANAPDAEFRNTMYRCGIRSGAGWATPDYPHYEPKWMPAFPTITT